MTTLTEVSDWIAENLPVLIAEHDIPGAAVAVMADGQVVEHAAGVLSKATGVEATPDSVFQIGSITKLWTSTLVMQLVDEGLVELDAPIRTYLPEFVIADEEAEKAITVRHLLTHTAGFEGDLFYDTGVGDDCVEKYLGLLHGAPQLFPPGTMWSYNNAGFSVLGRLVEVLRGKPYDTALREHLIEPLGITHAAPSAYEAILFRAAVGHIEESQGSGFDPTKVWALARSNAPAGSMLAMSPRSLMTFARMHMSDGRSESGEQILAPGTAALMHAHHADVPGGGGSDRSWGLGFIRNETPSGLLVGHNGATIGQFAYLLMAPEANVAVAVLTNGGNVGHLFRRVTDHVLGSLAGITPPPETVPPAEPAPLDASAFVGSYACEGWTCTISQEPDGSVWLDVTPNASFAEAMGEHPERWELVRFSDDTLISRERQLGMHPLYTFVGRDDDGRARYLFSSRALPRAEE